MKKNHKRIIVSLVKLQSLVHSKMLQSVQNTALQILYICIVCSIAISAGNTIVYKYRKCTQKHKYMDYKTFNSNL